MSIRDAMRLVREMGPAWLAWRALYEVELRSGLLCKRFWPRPIDRLLARSLGVAPPDLNNYLLRNGRRPVRTFSLTVICLIIEKQYLIRTGSWRLQMPRWRVGFSSSAAGGRTWVILPIGF